MSKQLINKDVINLVASEIENTEIDRLDLSKLFAIRIGNILLQKSPGQKPYLTVPEGVDKTYVSAWRSDVGSVLMLELKKNEPELYELRSAKFTALLKRISHEEEDAFAEKGFLHIKIGDYYYVIIKVISANSQYYQKTSDFDIDCSNYDEEIIVMEEDESEEDDDNNKDDEPQEKSYRLF